MLVWMRLKGLLFEVTEWILIQEVRKHERYMEAAAQTRVYDGK
jgi:hypothetical protein